MKRKSVVVIFFKILFFKSHRLSTIPKVVNKETWSRTMKVMALAKTIQQAMDKSIWAPNRVNAPNRPKFEIGEHK